MMVWLRTPALVVGLVFLAVGQGCRSTDGSGVVARAADAGKGVATEVATGLTEGLPGLVWPVRVAGVVERLGYLEARLRGERSEQHLLFARTGSCRSLLREGGEVEYSKGGSFGEIQSGHQTCRALGSFDLEALRARGGKSGGLSASPRPRAQASYRVAGSDEGFILLRGRFPLVAAIGIGGGGDIAVLVPNSPLCAGLETRSTASMEYRTRGAPLILVVEGADCPLAAAALPH